MGLPFVVEYLMAQVDRKIGNVLVSGGIWQLVGVLPPQTMINFTVVPEDGDYARIFFNLQFDHQIVPNVFWGSAQYTGSRLYEGFITQSFIDNTLDYLIFTSQSSPMLTTVRNLTNLNQYYGMASYYLTVDTEATYYKVLDCINRMQTTRDVQAYFKANNKKQDIIIEGTG